jgi:transcriptional regulator with XRE-family HTH domain
VSIRITRAAKPSPVLHAHPAPAATEEDGGADMRRRLRAERERRGLSLRKLAGEIGVSPSALSQIETGKSRPSVTTLYAIVSALGLSLDALFAPDGGAGAEVGQPRVGVPSASPRPFVHRAGKSATLDFTSGVHWERLSPPGDVVELLWLTYQPGAASGEDGQFTRHLGHEYGVVISGRLGVSVGFETYEIGRGDAISFPSSAPHHLRALGDEPALAVWFLLENDPRRPADR